MAIDKVTSEAVERWRKVAAQARFEAQDEADQDTRGLLLTIGWCSDRIVQRLRLKGETK